MNRIGSGAPSIAASPPRPVPEDDAGLKPVPGAPEQAGHRVAPS